MKPQARYRTDLEILETQRARRIKCQNEYYTFKTIVPRERRQPMKESKSFNFLLLCCLLSVVIYSYFIFSH